jgi:tetratricopeptide (TPR) repeat protein
MSAALAHPEAEDLGRFVEGTLDEAERKIIVAHLADCDDCRIVMVDASSSAEAALTETAPASHRWWLAIAAGIVLVAVGAFVFNERRDPLSETRKSYAKLEKRPLEARLSGYPYVSHRVNRGGDEADLSLQVLQADAAEVAQLRGSDAKTLHARGIGILLEHKNTAGDALAPLQAATTADPNNVTYQSDLAAALIAAGRSDPRNLERALATCDRALQIDPRAPDALFNRAVALQALDRTQDAIAAYQRYLAIDSSSPWADEAKQHLELLLPPR